MSTRVAVGNAGHRSVGEGQGPMWRLEWQGPAGSRRAVTTARQIG